MKAAHENFDFKGVQQFKFKNPSSCSPSDPPSGKIVCEVEETKGNGWAVAIFGCPEVNPFLPNIVRIHI